MHTGLRTISSDNMAVILLLFVAALAGNAVALNETPTVELVNNDIREEIVSGNVEFDDKSLYAIDNSTEISATAEEPSDALEINENDDQSEPEEQPVATPVPDESDNSTTTESNTIETEQNEQMVEFTDMLTTKLKQIANDFETLVDNDKKLVDVGKMTPQTEEKIQDELLSEIDTVMGLIPKEILEAIRDEEETPVDIEVTITYDDTASLGMGGQTRKVTATNGTAFTECNKAVPQSNTVRCEKSFGPVCQLHRYSVPNAYPIRNYNMINVPLMQARFRPRYNAISATTPRAIPVQQVYATSSPLAPVSAMHAIGQMTQPLPQQGVRRSHTTTESHNVLTGDAVVTEESREESETLRGPVLVHSVHSDLIERLIPAQHRFPFTPVQQYFVPRAA